MEWKLFVTCFLPMYRCASNVKLKNYWSWSSNLQMSFQLYQTRHSLLICPQRLHRFHPVCVLSLEINGHRLIIWGHDLFFFLLSNPGEPCRDLKSHCMLLYFPLTGSCQWVRPQLHLCKRSRAAQHGEFLSCMSLYMRCILNIRIYCCTIKTAELTLINHNTENTDGENY